MSEEQSAKMMLQSDGNTGASALVVFDIKLPTENECNITYDSESQKLCLKFKEVTVCGTGILPHQFEAVVATTAENNLPIIQSENGGFAVGTDEKPIVVMGHLTQSTP